MRKERRESKPAHNWKEEVEEKLIVKTKKRYATWTEELNLDNLADLGQQWWVVRVSRVSGHYTAELLANSLAKNYPEMDFKVYIPSVQIKRKLKNGSISIKPKPIFPGCVFLKCVLDKEMHDFIREVDGVGGFIGSKVGNTKRQINKPRPVSKDDMEAIFRHAKEEQEKADQAFEDEKKVEEPFDPAKMNVVYTDTKLNSNFKESVIDSYPKTGTRKTSKSGNVLKAGSSIRVLSGTFAEFVGLVKKVNRKTQKATVGFTLFGKETIVDIDVSEIVVETK